MTITRDQFRLQVDRLADTFGDKAFSEQRELMIWDAVKNYSYADVIDVVDKFIRESKLAPLPKDFAQAIANYGAKMFALGERRPNANCRDCWDSGFVRLERKENHEPWAKAATGSAPCHCARGLELIEAGKRKRPRPIDFGPQFSDAWLSSYQINRDPEPEGAA